MNPITFDEWGAQEVSLLWATENGGNASQVIQYLEQNQCTYEATKESSSAATGFQLPALSVSAKATRETPEVAVVC